MHDLFEDKRYLIPFRSTLLPQIFTDTLVIGSGVAGLRAAVAAGQQGDVIVLAKGSLDETNTRRAQGGIAVSIKPEDDPFQHMADTLAAGADLCDESAVSMVCQQGPDAIKELLNWGLELDRDAEGELRAGREGGHHRNRILHSQGDATGFEFQRCLLERVGSLDAVRLFDRCFVLDLITPSNDQGAPVMGAITHHPRFGLQMIWARATILASGGSGMIFRETSNPPVATGDGLAMAYRAGAAIADMAFVQFHPTTLYLPGAPRLLITEAVRGEGAHLLDDAGHRFMPAVHKMAELAPRDVVSRAIVQQLAKCGGSGSGGNRNGSDHGDGRVWLDARHIKGFSKRFPGIDQMLGRFELNPARDLIPVHPAAHYTVGGVWTDLQGRTSVPGLFAVGETACCGVHGGNRLASNSLLEGLVLGKIAGDAATESEPVIKAPVAIISDIRPSAHGVLDLADVRSSLRSTMWRNAGIERIGSRLDDVRDMLAFWGRYTLDKIFDEPVGWETQNMLQVAALVAESASWRKESRGCHARSDTPEPVDAFCVHDLISRWLDEPVLKAVDRSVSESCTIKTVVTTAELEGSIREVPL